MNNTAWLDLSCGASAEMLLGALVDAGVPFDVVSAAAGSTELPVALQRVPSRRGALTATWVITSTTQPQPPTTSLEGLPLTDDARLALAALGEVSTTDVATVSAICAGLAWLRQEGQAGALHAWPKAHAPLAQHLVDEWEPLPADLLGLTGLGAGSTESSDHAHVVRLVLTS